MVSRDLNNFRIEASPRIAIRIFVCREPRSLDDFRRKA